MAQREEFLSTEETSSRLLHLGGHCQSFERDMAQREQFLSTEETSSRLLHLGGQCHLRPSPPTSLSEK
jgi:hypothetical protein